MQSEFPCPDPARSGAGPETVVGLLSDRSIELIVAQLAILKTGAAFMPIDTGYPEERVKFMLDDISAPLIVTQSRFIDQIDAEKVNVVDMDLPEAYSADSSALGVSCFPGDFMLRCLYFRFHRGPERCAVGAPGYLQYYQRGHAYAGHQ